MPNQSRTDLVNTLNRDNRQGNNSSATLSARRQPRVGNTGDTTASQERISYNDEWDLYFLKRKFIREEDIEKPTTIDPRRAFSDADVRLAELKQEVAEFGTVRGEGAKKDEEKRRQTSLMPFSTCARKPEERDGGDYLPEIRGAQRCHRAGCQEVASIREHLLQHVLDDFVHVCDGGTTPDGAKKSGCGAFYAYADKLDAHLRFPSTARCYSKFRRPVRLSHFIINNPYSLPMGLLEAKVAYYLRNELDKQSGRGRTA